MPITEGNERKQYQMDDYDIFGEGDTTPDLTTTQERRREILKLHNHQIGISGFRGERSCHRKPVRYGDKRIGVKLRATGGGRYKAFFSQTQRSTAYTCPIAHPIARMRKEADVKFLLKQHQRAGGHVVAGTFTLKHSYAPAPTFFYDPAESFRFSDQWDKQVDETGKATIHEMLQSSGWVDFLADNPEESSYSTWDLTRRLDAVIEGTGFMLTARDLRRITGRVGTDITGYTVATEVDVKPAPSTREGYTSYWGRSSNNVHAHVLLFLSGEALTPKQLRQLKGELHARFAQAVGKHGFTSLLAGTRLDAVPSTPWDYKRVGAYQVKGVKHQADFARLGGSFWDALRASERGDTVATTWWQNFEGAMRGRHTFRISKSLFELYEVKAERERRDAEWRLEQPEVINVCFFDRTDWYLTTSVSPMMREKILLKAEQFGAEGLRDWLNSFGIPFYLEETAEEAEG